MPRDERGFKQQLWMATIQLLASNYWWQIRMGSKVETEEEDQQLPTRPTSTTCHLLGHCLWLWLLLIFSFNFINYLLLWFFYPIPYSEAHIAHILTDTALSLLSRDDRAWNCKIRCLLYCLSAVHSVCTGDTPKLNEPAMISRQIESQNFASVTWRYQVTWSLRNLTWGLSPYKSMQQDFRNQQRTILSEPALYSSSK